MSDRRGPLRARPCSHATASCVCVCVVCVRACVRVCVRVYVRACVACAEAQVSLSAEVEKERAERAFRAVQAYIFIILCYLHGPKGVIYIYNLYTQPRVTCVCMYVYVCVSAVFPCLRCICVSALVAGGV